MFEQPNDFREESDALNSLLSGLDDEGFEKRTQFKQWTINDVVSHLHAWNIAADLSLRDPEKFSAFREKLFEDIGAGATIREAERAWLEPCSGRSLLDAWHGFSCEMANRFADADPKMRVQWAGPDMSVRSSITARLMETWAHGQEIYDLLGVARVDGDRIRNIATLGVNTFGWTFINRGLEVPGNSPHVCLTAPSGAAWTWNEPSDSERVEGDATEFCQVVTQVRALGDTQLKVVGEIAQRWMSIAQCFAGAPEDPPAPGTRFTAN